MTLDTAALTAIQDVVQDRVREGRTFTAFEVSLEVKARGVRTRHRRLRNAVHRALADVTGPAGDYSRTLMDVGAPSRAWVYHPSTVDPSGYVPLARRDSGRARGTATPVPSGAFGVDRRGRLCLPVHLLARIGVRPGQRVAVRCDPATGQVVITRARGWRGPADTSYTAEPHGNVRLTRGVLGLAGLDGVPGYQVDGTDDTIHVRRFV
jgi:hypothetical protein